MLVDFNFVVIYGGFGWVSCVSWCFKVMLFCCVVDLEE